MEVLLFVNYYIKHKNINYKETKTHKKIYLALSTLITPVNECFAAEVLSMVL